LILAPRVGLEPTGSPCNDNDLQQSIAQKAENQANSRDVNPHPHDPHDPRLQAVIEAWPDLLEAVRAGISAMVTAASRDVGGGGSIEGERRGGT
jgi:hypothetical protein